MTSDGQAAPETGVATPSRVRTQEFALGAIALLLVVGILALGVVVHANRQYRSDLADARVAADTAARQAIINLESLSVTTLDAGIARVLAGSTGTFKKQFVTNQSQVVTAIKQLKTSSTDTIKVSAVVRYGLTSAVVLVGDDRSVTDSSNPQGVVASNRWRVELVKQSGRWLMTDLSPVA